MSVLIFAEHDNKKLKEVTYHTLHAAKQLYPEIDIVVIGWQCESVVEEARKLPFIRKVMSANAKVYQHQLAENTAALLASQAKNYLCVIAAASTFSKNILPRMAALLDVGMISDVVKIISGDTFVRPLFAGNILAEVQSQDVIKVLTIRHTAFPAVAFADTVASTENITEVIPHTQTQFESQTLTPLERPELTAARIIISGGRGLKSAESFKLLETLADHLGAAIGASRAAVDAGYAPNDYKVGQTGKIVAPDLYIAIGISGAIQHVAGMKDSKVIVAINNDPNAPIFQIADYVLVGDLFQILPELEKIL